MRYDYHGDPLSRTMKPIKRRIERRRHRRELEQILDREYDGGEWCRACDRDPTGLCEPCFQEWMMAYYDDDDLDFADGPDLSDLEDEDYDPIDLGYEEDDEDDYDYDDSGYDYDEDDDEDF